MELYNVSQAHANWNRALMWATGFFRQLKRDVENQYKLGMQWSIVNKPHMMAMRLLFQRY